MKEVFVFFGIILSIIFVIPILFTKGFEVREVISNDITVKDLKEKNDSYIIKLLHKQTGEIEELNLEEYLLGVVSAEMPASYEEEALKAQAIVARTYTMYTINNSKKYLNEVIHIAWMKKENRMSKWKEEEKDGNWKKIEDAVYNTINQIITYNGETIDAFFHSNSGGNTEEVSNVWGGEDLPYLKSVETSGESEYSQYSSEIIFSKEELENKIKELHPEFVIDYNKQDCIEIVEYTTGNRVKTIKLGNLNLSGVEVRSILGLKSANF